MNKLEEIKNILSYMQNEDRNGTWLEWFKEIETGESEFDSNYVIETLQQWYEDSDGYKGYLKMIEHAKEI